MELVLGSFVNESLEGKLHAGKDGLSEHFTDREIAIGLSFLRVGEFVGDKADLRPFPVVCRVVFHSASGTVLDLLLERLGDGCADGELDPAEALVSLFAVGEQSWEYPAASLRRRTFFTPSGRPSRVSLKTRRRS